MPVKFRNPNQNLEYDIAAEGEVFKTPYSGTAVFLRKGGQLYEIEQKDLPSGVQPVNINTGVADIIQAAGLQRAPDASSSNLAQFQSLFSSARPQASGDITRPIDPLLQQALGRAGQQGTSLAQTSITGLPSAPSSLQQVNELLAKGDILGMQASQKTGLPFTKSTGEVFAPTIMEADLKTATAPAFEKPKETTSLDVTKLDTTTKIEDVFKLSAPEQSYQTKLDELSKRIEEGAQRPVFQAEQERLRDVPALQKLVRDYSSQLKLIQLEASNIQQQVQAPGAGVTTAIDQRQKAEALRLNSVKALGVYALLQMAQGNALAAQDAADRATDLKFLPIEADIKARTANAQLAKDSPELSLEEKKRAQAIIDLGDKRTRLVNEAKEEERTIKQMGLKAIEAGLTDPIKINQIFNSSSSREAAVLAAPYLKKEKTGIVGEYQFYVEQEKLAGRTPLSFNDYQTLDANRKAKIAAAGVGTTGLSTQQYTALNQVTTRFQADPIINQSVKGNTAVAIADQIIANPEAATSQLKSLYILVKNLDPESAVREGELALANQTQSYLQQFGNTLTRITEGRVISPQAAKELAQATKELVTAWNETAQKRQKQYQSQAKTLGLENEFSSYLQGSELGFNQPQESKTGTPEATAIGSTVTIGDKIYLRTSEDNFEPIGSAIR